VADGQTGFLVPPGRPPAIAERVLTLLADESLRRRMGAAGRQRVEERFDLRRYAQGFAQVLESLAAGTAAMSR
jgi:glycosyltransferase involved in cell wall biosynthesis